MKKFAVVGNPIEQSKSPFIHQFFADELGIELEYNKILTVEQSFRSVITDFFRTGGVGLNITAPFKELAYLLAHSVTSRAEKAQAVNTLYWRDGQIVGDTTDGQGLVADLKFHGINLENQNVLLLGAGGAAKSVVASILSEKPARLVIANRTVGKAQKIEQDFNSDILQSCSLNNVPINTDIVINSTSCSLANEVPDLDVSKLRKVKVGYDMSYKKEITSFNQWLLDNTNAKVIDGLGMLIEQAAESFRIWHDKTPDTKELRQKLRDEN